MRDDVHDDLEHLPSLSARSDDDDDLRPATSKARPEPAPALRAAQPQVMVKSRSTGPLWALVGALLIAFGGLAWWSYQQLGLMEQQLVATQESFAKISEEAAGRLQAISGKVSATEVSASSGSEALKLQIRQLEGRLADQSRQQQSGLDKQFAQLSTRSTDQQALNAQLQAQVQALQAEVAALKSAQVDQGKLDARFKSLDGDIAGLKKQGNVRGDIDQMAQDILVLKSQQDRNAAGTSVAEFDAFRGQTTRSFNNVQSQLRNLQQQIAAPRAQ